MEDTTVEQRNKIQKQLTDKYEQKQLLFEETDPIVKKYVDELWQRILDTKRLDITCVEKRAKLIDADAMQHSNVREIGAESICHHSLEKLQLTPLLLSKGWQKNKYPANRRDIHTSYQPGCISCIRTKDSKMD